MPEKRLARLSVGVDKESWFCGAWYGNHKQQPGCLPSPLPAAFFPASQDLFVLLPPSVQWSVSPCLYIFHFSCLLFLHFSLLFISCLCVFLSVSPHLGSVSQAASHAFSPGPRIQFEPGSAPLGVVPTSLPSLPLELFLLLDEAVCGDSDPMSCLKKVIGSQGTCAGSRALGVWSRGLSCPGLSLPGPCPHFLARKEATEAQTQR